jgi:hypothetical protein
MRIRIDEIDVPEDDTDTIEPERGEHRVIVAQDLTNPSIAAAASRPRLPPRLTSSE